MLEGLIRWGVPLMREQGPDDAFRSHWIAWALALMLTDREPTASLVTLELQTGEEPIVVQTGDGAIHTGREP